MNLRGFFPKFAIWPLLQLGTKEYWFTKCTLQIMEYTPAGIKPPQIMKCKPAGTGFKIIIIWLKHYYKALTLQRRFRYLISPSCACRKGVIFQKKDI